MILKIMNKIKERTRAGIRSLAGEILIDAAGSERDIKTVKELLGNKGLNVNINISTDAGMTALMNAAHWENTDIVKILIEKGANLDFQDDYGHTALMYTLYNKDIDTAKMLIEKGADLDIQDSRKDTVLMKAVRKGNNKLAELLIEKGANLNLKNNDKETALTLAVGKGNSRLTQLLMEKCADTKNDEKNSDLTKQHHEANNSVQELEITAQTVCKNQNKCVLNQNQHTR